MAGLCGKWESGEALDGTVRDKGVSGCVAEKAGDPVRQARWPCRASYGRTGCAAGEDSCAGLSRSS